jgi:D-alanine-D-alanine ligase
VARLRIAIAHGADDLPKGTEKGRPKTDVEQVALILDRAGHDVSFVLVDGSKECLQRIARLETDLVFNMSEAFGEDDTKEPHVAAYFELVGLRFTGSGPRGLTLAMDKALAKKVLHFHEVLTPRFVTVFKGRLDWAHDIQFPVIVKPVREDGSIGIDFGSLASNIKELMERIDALHAEYDHPVIIEEYVDGREIYVGVIGNASPEALPPLELDLSHLPKGTPRIAGSEVKWEEGTRAYRRSRYVAPEDLDESVVEDLKSTAITAYQALGLRDYARIDFRLSKDGRPYFLEANPNPYLHSSSEFVRAARRSGRKHSGAILEIVRLALERYGFQV